MRLFIAFIWILFVSQISSANAETSIPFRVGQKLHAVQKCKNGIDATVTRVDAAAAVVSMDVIVWCWGNRPQSHQNKYWGTMKFRPNGTVALELTSKEVAKYGVHDSPLGRTEYGSTPAVRFEHVTLLGAIFTLTTDELVFR